MTSIDDFARLVPYNDRAKRLFAKCYLYVQKDDPFHLHFMVTVGKDESTGINDEETSDQPATRLASPASSFESNSSQSSDIYLIEPQGYFALTFGDGPLPEFPNLGWRVGRGTQSIPGTRNVDIMLTEPRDRDGKRLASNHFRLTVNTRSGFLVLLSGSATQSCMEYFVQGEWKVIPPNCSRVMYQKSNLIRAGLCEYELVYTITPENREAFVRKRQNFIREHLYPETNLYLYFDSVPGDEYATTQKYVLFETRGTGKFGWVNKGIDIRTGDPIAIKELRIQSKTDWLFIKSELAVGVNLTSQTGALPIIDSFCEHGKPSTCSFPEKYYFLLPLAISDLSRFRWSEEASRESKLAFLYGPLKGIESLHNLGIMHRDIRPANMLILSTNPPLASICDYGKATSSTRSRTTTIGPISTLAPEVWSSDARGYTKSVDLWAFGYAVAEILGYKCESGNPAITVHRHGKIISHLKEHAARKREDRDLIELTMKLLAWNPNERPTAVNAAKHHCWQPLVEEPLGSDEHYGKRRKLGKAHTSDGNGDAFAEIHKNASDKDTKSTEEFSEETKKMIGKGKY